MRVLLAIDGSAPSDVARQLVASLPWPEGSTIRVVAVAEPMSAVLTGLSPYEIVDVDDPAIAAALDEQLATAAAALEGPGRVVETKRLEGRPGTVIVREAARFRAGLIVLGSRGLGPLRSMLLGSVSAEVVDHAPCPVLVARTPSVDKILLPVDGSPSAQGAVDHLGGATYLAGKRVEVMTVAPLLESVFPSESPEMTDWASRHEQFRAEEERRRTEILAAAAAGQLTRDGFDTRWSIAVGDAAHEIIRAAEDLRCNLVVMGSRGLTGLDRILLGSVARNVLLHIPASVLIVREPVKERLPERDHAAVRVEPSPVA